MKNALISFKLRNYNSILSSESAAISFLNGNSIYVDDVLILSPDDTEAIKKTIASFAFCDCIFFLSAEKNAFLIANELKNMGLEAFDGGYFSGKSFAALLPDKFTLDYEESFLKALDTHFSTTTGKIVFKLFGVDNRRIEAVIEEIKGLFPNVFFHTRTLCSDTKCELIYDATTSKMEVDGAIKAFLKTFKNSVYAEDDIELNQRLYDLLKLRRQKLAVAESMTGGKIASKVVEVLGASDIFYEGLVAYATIAKERRLAVEHSSVVREGVVSEQVAFEMASALLKEGNATCSISITGYAGKGDIEQNDNLCFIGIGIDGKVEVYKYRFYGERKEIIETAANTALFLLLKSVENLD